MGTLWAELGRSDRQISLFGVPPVGDLGDPGIGGTQRMDLFPPEGGPVKVFSQHERYCKYDVSVLRPDA